MKTRNFLIPVLVACLAVFVGCGDKDKDFRDEWLGTYEGYCDFHSSTGADHQFDTVYTNESVTVSKQGNEGLVMDYLGQSFQVLCSVVVLKETACSLTTTMSHKAIPPHAILKEKRNKGNSISCREKASSQLRCYS